MQIIALLAVLGLIVVLAPGLGEVRDKLSGAAPPGSALAVVLEALSCALLRADVQARSSAATCPGGRACEIAWSTLAMGSILPASGAGGLALGAWILHEGGMPAERIARRSVAFFMIKSSVNFVAVAVIGTLMALGVFGPDKSPAADRAARRAAVLVIGLVLLIPRLASARPPRGGRRPR